MVVDADHLIGWEELLFCLMSPYASWLTVVSGLAVNLQDIVYGCEYLLSAYDTLILVHLKTVESCV